MLELFDTKIYIYSFVNMNICQQRLYECGAQTKYKAWNSVEHLMDMRYSDVMFYFVKTLLYSTYKYTVLIFFCEDFLLK